MTLPEAVWNEVVVDTEGQPGAQAIRNAPWIETQVVSNRDLVRALRQDYLSADECNRFSDLADKASRQFHNLIQYLDTDAGADRVRELPAEYVVR